MNLKYALVLSMTILSSCSHTPKYSESISKPQTGPLMDSYHGRLPASILSNYQSIKNERNWEVFAAQTDRCEETSLKVPLTKNEIGEALKIIRTIQPKLEKINSKIEGVNPQRAQIIKSIINKVAFLLDGADSVKCGGVAQYQTIDDKFRPVIFLSIRGATEKSWNTVIPHEYAHLVMRALSIGGGILDETWADLLSLSVNDFRPYFAEGDGERTLASMRENEKDKNTTEAMKESYKYSCTTKLAQRDYTLPRRLDLSYRGLQPHNVSCEIVSNFLRIKKTPEEKNQALYNYLFNWSPVLWRPRRVMSSNFAAVLNDIFNQKYFPEPDKKESIGRLITRQTSSQLEFDVVLDSKFSHEVIQNITKPISIEIQDENEVTAIRWTQYLGLYEPKLIGTSVEKCGRSNMTDCFCFSGQSVRSLVLYLQNGSNKAIASDLVHAGNISKGCYSFSTADR